MDKLTLIFCDVFDRTDLNLDGLSRENCPEWDSLAQVKIIIGIEEEFGVKFTMDQVVDARSVAELKQLLAARGVSL
jgi:acyl carrier protein